MATDDLRSHPIWRPPHGVKCYTDCLYTCTIKKMAEVKLLVSFQCAYLLFAAWSCGSHLTVSLGAAKVDELDDAFGGEHDVGTFDVTVDDAVVVKVVKAPGNLPGVVGNGTLLQGTKPANTHTHTYTHTDMAMDSCIATKDE